MILNNRNFPSVDQIQCLQYKRVPIVLLHMVSNGQQRGQARKFETSTNLKTLSFKKCRSQSILLKFICDCILFLKLYNKQNNYLQSSYMQLFLSQQRPLQWLQGVGTSEEYQHTSFGWFYLLVIPFFAFVIYTLSQFIFFNFQHQVDVKVGG